MLPNHFFNHFKKEYNNLEDKWFQSKIWNHNLYKESAIKYFEKYSGNYRNDHGINYKKNVITKSIKFFKNNIRQKRRKP